MQAVLDELMSAEDPVPRLARACLSAACARTAAHLGQSARAMALLAPPVQALHRIPLVLRRDWVLSDLRPRRRPAAFTRRARAPSRGTRRVADPGFTYLQFEALLAAAGSRRTHATSR
jgi:hypothetical protein